RVALADAAVVAKDDDADIVDFEVEGHALHAVRELDHLAGLDRVEPVDAGDAVADRQDLADLGDIGLIAEIGDLLFQDRGDFRGANFHLSSFYPTPFIASCRRRSRFFSEPSIIRDPTLTIIPPNRLGSTRRSAVTRRPSARRNCSPRAFCCVSFSGCAVVTSAVTSPRRSAS